MKVESILKAKRSGVRTVRPTDTIATVAMRLRQHQVGAMIVTGNGESLEGIISERDVALGLTAHGKDLPNLPASALMTTAVVTCTPDDRITDVAKTMTERRLRHLPVKQNERLVGVISIGDVLKHRLAELQLEARVLRDIATIAR